MIVNKLGLLALILCLSWVAPQFVAAGIGVHEMLCHGAQAGHDHAVVPGHTADHDHATPDASGHHHHDSVPAGHGVESGNQGHSHGHDLNLAHRDDHHHDHGHEIPATEWDTLPANPGGRHLITALPAESVRAGAPVILTPSGMNHRVSAQEIAPTGPPIPVLVCSFLI